MYFTYTPFFSPGQVEDIEPDSRIADQPVCVALQLARRRDLDDGTGQQLGLLRFVHERLQPLFLREVRR